mmetsp:Transcript_24502/g.56878  ORF Transcript_24502/g.56878 Transcript_24502/m.56878 type:complete len:759 (-) Transcript_24502:31-2307(-)
MGPPSSSNALHIRDAIAAFDTVLEQKLSALRAALSEEHRRLLGGEIAVQDVGLEAKGPIDEAEVTAQTTSISYFPHEHDGKILGEAKVLASSQLETFPKAPPHLNDWTEDEPEAPPPADLPESDRLPAPLLPGLQKGGSLLSSGSIKDPQKPRVKKGVTFLPHIEVCEYVSMESQSSSELRALWKWPDETDPDEDAEDILQEIGVSGPNANSNRCERTLSRCVTPPMSRRRMVWDSLALIILAVEVILFPLGAFEEIELFMTSEPGFIVLDWVSAVYWLIDMPLNFFSAYNTIEGKVEKRFSRTAKKYLKSWFCLDLLIVSLDWASLVGHYDAEFLEALRVGKTVRGIRIVRGVRILRLAKVAPMLQNMADSVHSEIGMLLFKISNIVLTVMCINHFIACFWYWLGVATATGGSASWTTEAQADTQSAGYQYVAAFHWSLSNFATATTRINAVNTWEHFFAIFVLFAGLVSFASSLSAITSAVADYRAIEVDTLHNEKKLRGFLGDRAISPAMSNRIWEFVRSRRRTRGKLTEAHVKLLNDLPKILRIELRRDMYLPLLQSHPLFSGLELADPHVISRLCDRGLEFRGVPPMEDVFNRAEKASHVYYVISGHLNYWFQRPQSRRAVSAAIDVNANEWLSEGALWFDNWVHFGWLRARTPSELLLVNVEVFQMVAMKSPSPYLGSTIYKQAWVRQIKDDVRHQDDGVTRLFKGRPTDLPGDRQITEQIAYDAFPDLARRYELRFSASALRLGSFSSRTF